jgi:hypothetical protein
VHFLPGQNAILSAVGRVRPEATIGHSARVFGFIFPNMLYTSPLKNEEIMNSSLGKYTFLFCLAVLFSVLVFSLGVIRQAEMLYAVLIFLAFGAMVMRIESFLNILIKLRGRNEFRGRI